MKNNSLEDRVTLIRDGHENIDKYNIPKVDIIMYNLGYLPKGDHGIVTRAETTILSIKKALDVLKEGGIMTIVSYIGHEGGKEEYHSVINYLNNLPMGEYLVAKYSFVNQINDPPISIIVEKRIKNGQN